MTNVTKKMIVAEEGGSVVLTCLASGTRPYVVIWSYKGDSSSMPLYSNIEYDGSLVLHKMSISSQGKYRCVVKNAAGSASHETRIIVSKCLGVFSPKSTIYAHAIFTKIIADSHDWGYANVKTFQSFATTS